MLRLTDLTIHVAGRPLLENASLDLPKGSACRTGGAQWLWQDHPVQGDYRKPSEARPATLPLQRVGALARWRRKHRALTKALIEIVLAADTERAMNFWLALAETETDAERNR